MLQKDQIALDATRNMTRKRDNGWHLGNAKQVLGSGLSSGLTHLWVAGTFRTVVYRADHAAPVPGIVV
ncbi:MAG: hypothetical protein AAF601_04815 [Pseudomonadota bacterium]